MSEHQQMQQSKESKPIFQKQATFTVQNPVSHPASIIQRARINPKSLTPADILQLQRTIGNRAVGRLLSKIRNPSKVQQVTIQRQTVPEEEKEPLQGIFGKEPEEETCPSCVQRQEKPEEKEPLQGKFETIQRLEPEEEEKLQMKSIIQRQEIPEEEEPLQGKFQSIQRQEIPDEETLQKKSENNTGMPDNLKAGVENLSGIDMSDVRVHYNSSKPAEVGALAYTQGANIHVAPGQEKHLPHEAWHVVQQAQGRVQATMQLKDEVPVNDDEKLEREADVMGASALQINPSLKMKFSAFASTSPNMPIQMAICRSCGGSGTAGQKCPNCGKRIPFTAIKPVAQQSNQPPVGRGAIPAESRSVYVLPNMSQQQTEPQVSTPQPRVAASVTETTTKTKTTTVSLLPRNESQESGRGTAGSKVAREQTLESYQGLAAAPAHLIHPNYSSLAISKSSGKQDFPPSRNFRASNKDKGKGPIYDYAKKYGGSHNMDTQNHDAEVSLIQQVSDYIDWLRKVNLNKYDASSKRLSIRLSKGPCNLCRNIIKKFRNDHPNIEVIVEYSGDAPSISDQVSKDPHQETLTYGYLNAQKLDEGSFVMHFRVNNDTPNDTPSVKGVSRDVLESTYNSFVEWMEKNEEKGGKKEISSCDSYIESLQWLKLEPNREKMKSDLKKYLLYKIGKKMELDKFRSIIQGIEKEKADIGTVVADALFEVTS